MTREYKAALKGPDGFFRGVRRVLSELNEEELSLLREMLARVSSVDALDKGRRWVGIQRHIDTVWIGRIAFILVGSRTREWRSVEARWRGRPSSSVCFTC
jgi:hypothetical protein